jgi:tetratricopeptide (TPR) repeat protein
MKFFFKLHIIVVTVFLTTTLFGIQSVQALDIKNNNLTTIPLPYLSSRYCNMLTGEQGINACNWAIISNPDDVLAWNNRGEKLFNLGRYSEALLSYNHALLINPEFSLVLANRCGVLSALNRYSEALISCKLAIEGNKQWGRLGEALAWNNQGDALFNLGNYEESLTCFDKALAIYPDSVGIQRNREAVLSKLKKSRGEA